MLDTPPTLFGSSLHTKAWIFIMFTRHALTFRPRRLGLDITQTFFDHVWTPDTNKSRKMGFFSGVSHIVFDAGIMSWDVLLTLLNLIRREHQVGHVTPEGHPGYGGHWPEFRPPNEGDSRCSCPAINAMANHGEWSCKPRSSQHFIDSHSSCVVAWRPWIAGIISRSGREISFAELNHHIRATYNFSPSFCSFVPHFAAWMLKKSYSKDTFDLEELDVHNGIEHDASIVREWFTALV
jgi:hypothetical protein